MERKKQKQGQNKKRPFRGKNNQQRRTRPHRHPRKSNRRGPVRVVDKLIDLELRYMKARKRYYEKFHTPDDRQRAKLEREFTESRKRIQTFLEGLNEKQLAELQQTRPELVHDLTYSNNHDLQAFPEKPTLSDIEDPHVTMEQKERPSYTSDTEESSGSMEEYKKLKGIVDAPVEEE